MIRAVEAKSGKRLWQYDPKVIEHSGERMRIMWDWNRGIEFRKVQPLEARDGHKVFLISEICRKAISVRYSIIFAIKCHQIKKESKYAVESSPSRVCRREA